METTYSPATEAGAGPVPIIFIPGILGSPLYLPENGKKLWLSANFLKMAERMAIEYPLDVKNNDINQQMLPPYQREGGHLRKSFFMIDRLCQRFPSRPVYHFSYDFRQSSEVSADALKQQIDYSLADYSKEVDLICHSMGGLVAAAYIAKYGFCHIRKIVFLGTPFEGSSLITKLLITGDIGSTPGSVADFFGLSHNLLMRYPSVAELLPSDEYLSVYPLYRGSVPFSPQEMYAYFSESMPETFERSQKFRRRLHEKVYPLLLKDPRCFFGIGTGKTTLRTLSFDAERSNHITEIVDDGGDSEVNSYSATMCGAIEHLGVTRYRLFSSAHSELLRIDESLHWVFGILAE
ncbi:MAG TPA: alpha/beta fold hydrolase [Methanocorpusculum sp.]|nr:alpha/beta fold hydrolase [Methanocorpusculum sp.]